MYLDYRSLISVRVKAKFPIPIIKELLEELHGDTIFRQTGP